MTAKIGDKQKIEKTEKVEKVVENKKEEKTVSVPVRKTMPEITDEAIINALKKAGGKAQITPLYEAFDKTGFEDMESSSLKTKLRAHSKKMADAGKIKSTRIKRSFEFALKSSK